MYQAILLRLQAADIDQEVKEKSITCMYVSLYVYKSNATKFEY